MKLLSNGEEISQEVYDKVRESLETIAEHSGYVSEVADSLCRFLLQVAPLITYNNLKNEEPPYDF